MEFEKTYDFPYAGRNEDGEYIKGMVGEAQIISILGELPNEGNYDTLIQKAESKELENWKKTLEYWRDNKIF